MQSRVIRLDAYSRRSETETSRIRRRPQGDDRRLAEAIRVLHEQGPRALCELWDEVTELKSELSDLRGAKPEPRPTQQDDARTLVDRLREE